MIFWHVLEGCGLKGGAAFLPVESEICTSAATLTTLCAQEQHLAAAAHCLLEKSPPPEAHFFFFKNCFYFSICLSHMSTQQPSLSPFSFQPHVLEAQGGGPSHVRATHGALRLIHTAPRGEVVLHHKLNKTRKTLCVYSSWVQGQTRIK